MQGTSARWLTAAAVVASFFWLLGAAPLFDVDEGAFSQATLEMFQRGDFLSTTLNGEARALLAALLLATSLGVFIIGRAATADALLNLLLAASMFAAWLHLSTGRRRWLYATHAAIGLGVLAKGPIAILVPFATTFI